MNEREIANAGDEFKARVADQFGFLVSEFGFEPGVDESSRYSHRLVFRNAVCNQLVEVVNAFHPVDYGFEVNVHPAEGPRPTDDRQTVYYKLKEAQQAGFPFIAEAAQQLRALLEADRAS